MTQTIKDIPRIPDYIPGQTDHDYLNAAWANGPLAIDKYGFIVGFPQRILQSIMDDRWTRQIEHEGMIASGVTSGPMYDFVGSFMLFANGEAHRRRRGPLVRTFAHKLIERMRGEVADRCQALVAGLKGSGEVDFLDQIAGPLPANVIAAILGVPEQDMPRFAKHVYSAIRGLSLLPPDIRAEADADMGHLLTLVDGLIADRRGNPDDGLMSEYLTRTADGDQTQMEVLCQMVGLVVAGSDTTRGALTATVSHLLQNPDQWALLVQDPDTHVAGAVSEGLRYDPVIGSFGRFTTEDREVEGVFIPSGSLITASMITALRDPDVYADPDVFDITRSDHPRLHPVFGGGPHRCLGEALARIELEEMLKALVRQVPDLTLIGEPARLRGYGAVRPVSGFRVRM